MSAVLADEKCQACRPDSPRVPDSEAKKLMAELTEWTIVVQNGVQRLQRIFKFKDFAEALDFTNRIGAVAEAEQHHPLLITEWGKVTVHWWTHSIGGLHRNDFIMAARTDRLL